MPGRTGGVCLRVCELEFVGVRLSVFAPTCMSVLVNINTSHTYAFEQTTDVLITTLFCIPESDSMFIILAYVLYASVVSLHNGYLDIFVQYFSP